MTQLMNFDFKGNDVRVFHIHNDVWFTTKDVAHNLEYADPSMMLKHVDDEDKMTINPQEADNVSETESFGSNTFKVSVINESGLYACIFGSKKPKAKEFKKWVTSKVLPEIRKTGKYENEKAQMSAIEVLEQMLETYKEQQQKIENNTQQIQQTQENLETTINDVEILKERIENNRNSSEIGNILVTLRKYFDIKNIEVDRKLIGAGKKLSKLCRIADIDFKDNGIGQSNEYPYWLMEVFFQTITDLDCDMHDLLTLYIRHYSSEQE